MTNHVTVEHPLFICQVRAQPSTLVETISGAKFVDRISSLGFPLTKSRNEVLAPVGTNDFGRHSAVIRLLHWS